MSQIKDELFKLGQQLVKRFCHLNGMPQPLLKGKPPKSLNKWQATGLYDPSDGGIIYVDVTACATLGTSGASWSWPGYVIDRTPYGVHCHELGHHMDSCWSASPYRPTLGWQGGLSPRIYDESKEPPITTYAPNKAEWFAECFRLFCTNPSLLKHIRPRTYALIRQRFKPVDYKPWRTVLAEAPGRTIQQAEKKIRDAYKL
jgi:hypothetical protein